MAFFPKDSTYIGIEKGENSLKMARIRASRKGWVILDLKEISEASRIDRNALVATALPTSKVLIRPFSITLKKEKDIQKALPFHVEPYLPFPVDEAVLQACIVQKEVSGTKMTLFATQKKHLADHLEALTTFDPEQVSAAPHVLLHLLPESADPALLIHVGERETSVVLAHNGALLMARAFESQDLQNELPRTLLSISTSFRSLDLPKIWLVGCDREKIEELCDKSIAYLPPVGGISQEEMNRYGMVIATAIASAQKEALNFRKEAYASRKLPRRIKGPLLIFAIASVAFCGTLFALSKEMLTENKKRVAHHFEKFLETENVSPSSRPQTIGSYRRELAKIEKNIRSRPNTFALHPLVPKVSDLLLWVTTHPNLYNAGIELLSMHYQMTSHPDFAKEQDLYKVRVELEFSANGAEGARALHDLLTTANSFVDEKTEVQWTAMRDKWRASFFLKDQTRYPR